MVVSWSDRRPRLRPALRLAGAVLALALALPGCGTSAPASLANGEFASDGDGAPAGWHLSEAAAAKGDIAVVDGRLVLSPSAANTPSAEPLGLGQLVAAAPFRGERLTLSATIGAEAPAVAVVGLAVLAKDGSLLRTLALRGEGAPGPQSAKDAEPLPAEAETLILFASAEGMAGRAIFDDIRLAALPPPAPAPDGTGAVTRFSLDPGARGRPMPLAVFGTNVEWIRKANGLWNEGTGAIDVDMTRMAKAAGITLIRFPGGVWSDTYDWRQGVGPNRPVSVHIPGQDEKSPNVIGTDEIAGFARSIGARLMITVNAGHGTPAEAGAWAAYIRDHHGADIAPWWEIGNELYMANDLSGASMSPEAYAAKVRPFAEAIRRELPEAHIAAIGLKNYGPYRFNAHDDWNDVVLREAGDVIDSFAIHNAYAPLVVDNAPRIWPDIYRSMMAAPALITRNLADTAAQIDRWQPDRDIGLAVTEWGPLFALDPANPYFDHVKTMGSAVFVARTLNAFLGDPRVEAAAFFKLSDWLNAGWIAPVPGGGWRETPALLAFGLYRRTLGAELVPVTRQQGPEFDASARGFTGAVDGTPLVEAAAGRQGGGFGVMLSNADLKGPQQAVIALPGRWQVEVTLLSGPSPLAHRGTLHIDVPGVPFAKATAFGDDWFGGSKAGTVGLTTLPPQVFEDEFSLILPATSVAALRLTPAS